MYKTLKTSLFVCSGLFALLASAIIPVSATASSVGCSSADTVMYVVAHQDDALLFQNPSMQHDITAGKCVTAIFLTAGEAGRSDPSYWQEREEGTKAASALMAGVANAWTDSGTTVSGHTVPMSVLDANPKITLVFLRLPDGGVDGGGFGTYGGASLQKLWIGNIASVTSDDSVNTYTRQGLIDTLTAFMVNTQPSRINTQDFVGTFGDEDHSDHHATAFFIKSAHDGYDTIHKLYSYVGYQTHSMTENVFGVDLSGKEDAFFAYTPHDRDACQNIVECAGMYLNWLKREYWNGSEQGGDVCSNIAGKQTEVPEGNILVGGQCVLSDSLACASDVSTLDIVSDTSNTVSTEGNAVAAFTPPTWTANISGATWIWNAFHPADPFNGETVTFTKEISVTGTPTSANIILAGDDNYEASLNSNQFAVVPGFNNYAAGSEQSYDVSSLLHEGSNTLSITVHNIAMETNDPEVNPAGLLYKLSVTKNSCSATPPPVCPEGTTGTYPECVPVAPVDVCSNLEGTQTTIPEGLIFSGEGQCVPTPESTPPSTPAVGSTDTKYPGCTNTAATNFNRLANQDDGSCMLPGGTSEVSTEGSIPVVEAVPAGEVLGAATTAPELVLPAECSAYLRDYLKQGKKNDADQVKLLQQFLNEEMGASLPVSGYFGSLTKNWVKKFQVKYHAETIKPWVDAGYKGKDIENGTGYVYKTTKYEINMLKCSNNFGEKAPDLTPDL